MDKPVYTLSIDKGLSDRSSSPKHHILHEQFEVSVFVLVITIYIFKIIAVITPRWLSILRRNWKCLKMIKYDMHYLG